MHKKKISDHLLRGIYCNGCAAEPSVYKIPTTLPIGEGFYIAIHDDKSCAENKLCLKCWRKVLREAIEAVELEMLARLDETKKEDKP